jgi:predicted nucleic acid-binding protein
MSHLFLDSSALAKRYLPEQGTTWLREQITNTESVIVSRLTSVEVMSAVARRRREGAISVELFDNIRRLLEKHFLQSYTVIDVNEQVVHDATNFLSSYSLRAYDAVQLATARIVNARLIANQLFPIRFVCGDIRLLQVAIAEGMFTDNPNEYP